MRLSLIVSGAAGLVKSVRVPVGAWGSRSRSGTLTLSLRVIVMSTSSLATTVGSAGRESVQTRPRDAVVPRSARRIAGRRRSGGRRGQRGGGLAGDADVVAPGRAGASSAASTSALASDSSALPHITVRAVAQHQRDLVDGLRPRRGRRGRRGPAGSAATTGRASASASVPVSAAADARQARRRPWVVAEDHAVGVHAAQPAADLDHGDGACAR